MSRQLINEYRAELDRVLQVSGSRRESVVREPFKDLLKRWGKSQDLHFVAEHAIVTPKGNRIYTDGALLHGLRVPFGYWEAKDQDDKLDGEIADKFRKGYPKDNIIFSDDVTAVLYQNGHEQLRAAMDDADALLPLLGQFFGHERQEVADFKKAVRQFAVDLPAVLTALRDIIQKKRKESKDFARAQDDFLKHARDAINPAVTDADVQEMLIQHILTEDIFAKVFENPDFHRQNNVAAALYALEDKLFGYGEKQRLLKALQPYYAGISATAAVIDSHTEKQGFLKGLYENFYKVYNPMAADRLGVVYTPGEIVRFMIKSADWLCETHFGKNLVDSGVEILDPATGTGTFIVELLESFRGYPDKLRHKYKEELHANEVAILPYYVANLNIEATYAAITGQFAEYPNLCFVDTLDNVAAIGAKKGEYFGDLLGSLSDENMARVKRQNERKISVVIGNPPYNAWQESFNDGNPNRYYKRIDDRIAKTYVKEGTGQNQSSVYDMYTRFVRWASDRLDDEGILALVIGRKPVSKGAYNGFRKVVAEEFSEVWIVDLGGDVVDNPNLSGTTHNVFGIKVGVMVAFFVKKQGATGCRIRYIRRPEMELAEDKLSFLSSGRIDQISFEEIKPDRKNDWLNQAIVSWDNFIPLIDDTNRKKSTTRVSQSVFQIMSSGLQTKQDEWAFDYTRSTLAKKMQMLIERYSIAVAKGSRADAPPIKWHRELDKKRKGNHKITFSSEKIRLCLYRPYSSKFVYFDRDTNSQSFRLHEIFRDGANQTVSFLGAASSNSLAALACSTVFDTCLLKNGNGSTQGVSRYRYTKSGERVDNITDWAVAQFKANYASDLVITKDAIFAYCYAVLHDPLYCEKYALNLKREFPRIPFYPNFAQWVKWGETLLKLHIDYEKVKPAKLTRVDTPAPRRANGTHPKPKLRSNPETGNIVIDDDTQLTGVPVKAWEYRLGNRSAIDWVLDQHKEKTPRDPTIREKFNTYRFADYKKSCIELLGKVVKVSVDTVAITEAMKALDRSEWEK